MDEKIFVIFNTTSFGDVLVTNTLVQNVKYYYPDSKIVFVCNTPMEQVAKYQDSVNEVICYDKNKMKGIFDILSFVKKFPYKKPFASIVTYSNERNLIISRLIGAKHIISHHKFKFWNTKEKYELKEYYHMKDKWGSLIEPLTGEHKNLPIKYNAPVIHSQVVTDFSKLINPVLISPTSNYKPKDMNIEFCIEVFELLKQKGYTPVLIGAGTIGKNYSDELENIYNGDFVNLVNKTSFVELANIFQKCVACISVDTGTMHFANALNTPLVEVFYNDVSIPWESDTNLYPVRILYKEKNSPNDIIAALQDLCGVMV